MSVTDIFTVETSTRMRAGVVVPQDKTVRLSERPAPGHPAGAQVLLRIRVAPPGMNTAGKQRNKAVPQKRICAAR
ncbi:MAG TPA: hypothetical protein VKX45_17580 [Bryobacteraceae bacterium]|jgi:hypothetical protein|nr:hypothetical protein [Bryobacteraceae bacterium]